MEVSIISRHWFQFSITSAGAVLYAEKPSVPNKRYGLKELESFQGKTIPVFKYLNESDAKVEHRAVHLNVEIAPMKYPNEVREESYGLFQRKGMTYDGVNKTIAVFDTIWKTLVQEKTLVLEASAFGKKLVIPYTGAISTHLKVAATAGSIEYKYLGRYCSANILTNVLDEIREKIRLSTEQQRVLDEIEHNQLQAENHISGSIARTAYQAFNNELSAFANFNNKAFKKFNRGFHSVFNSCDVERLSYHPTIRPSWAARPTTFVAPKTIPELDLIDARRHGNAYHLTLMEQNAQIFYFRSFWGKYELLKQLAAKDNAFQAELGRMETIMTKAQARWDAKWAVSTVRTMVNTVVDAVSPWCKRKREDSDDEADKRMRV